MRLLRFSLGVVATLWLSPARAEDVVAGAIYPLTASSDIRAAIETALDIVNGTHDPLELPAGDGGGIERLGGAKLRIVFADDDGDPAKAADAAERLIGTDGAVALLGGVTDAEATAIASVANRHTLPYLSLDAAGTGLTQRDQDWLFRVSTSQPMAEAAVFQLLAARNDAAPRPIRSLALVAEDTERGRDGSSAQHKLADAAAMTVVADLKVAPETTLAAQAEAIAGAKPDAVLPRLAAGEAVALLRALAERNVSTMVIASGPGLSDPAIAGSPDAAAAFAVASFADDAKGARPALDAVNTLFRARTGHDLTAPAARALTGVLLLADVLDRAGSTKPLDLRTALMATDTPGERMVLPWAGIRFDTNGQNVLATPVIRQVQSGRYVTVFPPELAAAAPQWPPLK